jgi:hypothetical protein
VYQFVQFVNRKGRKMSSENIEAFWQDATADDVARVMAGERVEARFRDVETEPWTTPRALGGWSNQGWVSALTWNHCQVYREPSWWTDKPDPGPGFRLLEKFPDEELKPGDEAWDLWDDKQWSESESANGGGNQVSGVWYRRRIEAVELGLGHYVLRVGDSASLPNGQTITITAKGFEVTQ